MTPLREYGLVGDGHTAALVSSRGEVDWWCAPRFDSPPVFDALLGGERRARTSQEGAALRFAYEPDTNVLRAEWAASRAWYFLPYPRRGESRIVCIQEEPGGSRSARQVDARGQTRSMDVGQAEAALEATREAWRAWIGDEAPPQARRSLLVLKLLTDEPTGAVVAAPTTSLPEVPGGVRNWDYRYAWIRDTAFCAQAYARWGKRREAARIAEWLLARIVPDPPIRVLYRVDGTPAPDEREVNLPGYAQSRPVRVGNGAIRQFQLDAYGHLIETLDVCHALDEGPLAKAWPHVRRLVEEVVARWREPDNGIWEIPAGARHHTYSKVMAWRALERVVAIAKTHGLPAPLGLWEMERDRIRQHVLEQGVDPKTGAFRQAYDEDAPDASTLRIPLVGFIGPRDAISLATLGRVREELGRREGLLLRYRAPDGLPGSEGAFLACSFWLAELEHAAGDEAGARATFEAAAGHAGPLGLLPEEIDPGTGDFLGNYPQAISHATHLCAAHALRVPKPAQEVDA